jgi:hypothetical protein
MQVRKSGRKKINTNTVPDYTELRHIKILSRALLNKTNKKQKLFNTACLTLRLALMSHKTGSNTHNTLKSKQQVRELLQQVRAM